MRRELVDHPDQVIEVQHQQHMSYERLQETLWELFGVTISQGGIACVRERAGNAAEQQAEAIQQAVQASPVIRSDEASARVDGRNHWQWVSVGFAENDFHQPVQRRKLAPYKTYSASLPHVTQR